MIINWFPGHMAKARRMIEDNIKKVDMVIELLDARIPISSRNPMIKEFIKDKPHLIILNKVDLADPRQTKEWIAHFEEQGIRTFPIDATAGKGRKQLIEAIQEVGQPIVNKWKKKGIKNRSIRTIILGIPNVGKSTLINFLAQNNAAQVANKPGKTRGPQWVRLRKNMELLDTPGVLWPKLEDQRAAKRLAITGAISDDVYDMEEVVHYLLEEVLRYHEESFMERYKLTEEKLASLDTKEDLVDCIGAKRGCLRSGGVVDRFQAMTIILKDYRTMKLGPITFDRVDEMETSSEES